MPLKGSSKGMPLKGAKQTAGVKAMPRTKTGIKTRAKAMLKKVLSKPDIEDPIDVMEDSQKIVIDSNEMG